MRAILICNQRYDKEVKKIIGNCEQKDILIITSSVLKQEFAEKNIENIVEYLDVYAEEHFLESEKIIYDMVESLTQGNKFFEQTQLPYITINSLHAEMVRILVNFQNLMDIIIEKYHITELVLYGGNESVPFLGINLGEGEQLFRWLYKRQWFLNYFANKMYDEKLQIIWKKQEQRAKLEFISYFRLFALNMGKCLKKCHSVHCNAKIEIEQTDKKIVYLVVRIPHVVETLLPVYNIFEETGEYLPIFIAYENYSNNTLVSQLEKYGVRYVNLNGYIHKKDVLKKMRMVYSHKMKKTGMLELKFGNRTNLVQIQQQRIIRELKVYWFDAMLLEEGLDMLKHNSNSTVAYLINAETHSWVAATQGLWAKKHGVKSIGVSFVNLVVCPRSSWMDVYFMNSQAQKDLLADRRPKEKYAYVGPIGYDLVFNTSNHKKRNLETIGIFTQPEAFREDAFRMLKALIKIREKHQFTWNIIVKLHPRERDVEAFKKYEDYGYIQVIFKEKTSLKVLQNTDLALSIHSTTLEQAVLVGTPALSVNFDSVHNMELEFLRGEIIHKVTDEKELEEYILGFQKIEEQYEKERNDYIKEHYGAYMGDGAEKMLQYLEKEECE